MLVAPVETELKVIAGDLRQKCNVEVRVIAKDIRQPNAAEEIFAEVNRSQPIGILVNNAGHGQRGRFWEIPIETDVSMIELNILSYLRLTKLFLPQMIERGSGRVLNTASVAGFEPGPMQAVYHATKAFVLSWSEAIATELEDTGITVTALCPGPTDTDFFEKADAENTRAMQMTMAPQEVAQLGYEALMDGKRVVVAGAVNKLMVFSRHLMPMSAQAKMNEKMYENIPKEDQKVQRGDKEYAAAEKGD